MLTLMSCRFPWGFSGTMHAYVVCSYIIHILHSRRVFREYQQLLSNIPSNEFISPHWSCWLIRPHPSFHYTIQNICVFIFLMINSQKWNYWPLAQNFKAYNQMDRESSSVSLPLRQSPKIQRHTTQLLPTFLQPPINVIY